VIPISGGAWSGSISAVEGSADPAPIEGSGWIGGIIKKTGVRI